MSSRRQGTPLSEYSLSPERNSVREICTSLNSVGNMPSELSIVSDTSARPNAGRLAVPAKMTSSIFWDRTDLGACAPRTHAIASTTLDLPLPFGPTTTVTPGSSSRSIESAKDLKPFIVNVFRYTVRSGGCQRRSAERLKGHRIAQSYIGVTRASPPSNLRLRRMAKKSAAEPLSPFVRPASRRSRSSRL